jgi:valyl-tRNA synthetase
VLPVERPLLAGSAFPEEQAGWGDSEAVEQTELLMAVITGIRNIRSEAEVHPSTKIEAFVVCGDSQKEALLSSFGPAITDMTRLCGFTVGAALVKPADAATYICGDLEIFVPLKGLVDIAGELAKLVRERQKIETKLTQVNGKLTNAKFIANAPAEVVAKEQEKKAMLDATLAKIGEAEARLKQSA